MQLTLWSYEGPPHVGAMRIAASMRDVHYVLHAPQGDTYADLLFTMIERHDRRPPVTYTTFQARDLGGDTAQLVKTAVSEAFERHRPSLMLVGESCTAELLQDQAGTLALGTNIPAPIVPLELPAYSKKENWGAAETLYQITRALLEGRSKRSDAGGVPTEHRRPRANLLGPTALGFRCRDDLDEIKRLLGTIGIEVNVVAPMAADIEDVRRLPDADFNIDLYPEVSRPTARWLERHFGLPYTRSIPMGLNGTREFVSEVAALAGLDPAECLRKLDLDDRNGATGQARMRWYARSVDSTYLTGKRVFIFGDATHVLASARIAAEEMGFTVVGIGTYAREFAREVREAASRYGVTAIITDDYLEVERAIADCTPELVLGTQMERHIAKRLGIACAVISAPIHVQDAPARFSPVYGIEGANVLFDTWVHPLVMGLEEHLLQMFRGDFEFHDEARPSHLPAVSATTVAAADISSPNPTPASNTAPAEAQPSDSAPTWTSDGEQELRKIPFFVRAKARRNTERFAQERGMSVITVETLYEAKAHFGR